jgi:hypothetical protein
MWLEVGTWPKLKSYALVEQHAFLSSTTHQQDAMRRVVVTGLGLVTPLGIGMSPAGHLGGIN